MTQVLSNDDAHIRRYQRYAVVFLLAIALFTLLDILEDWHEGSSLGHIGLELCIIASAVSAARLLWRGTVSPLQEDNRQLRSELAQKSDQLAIFRAENAQLVQGFLDAVEHQLEEWALTPAEAEVAVLLLKGLSLKEISGLRETSERTVRQQAAAVYAKSKLEGRAQLAAYFIESLLEEPGRKS